MEKESRLHNFAQDNYVSEEKILSYFKHRQINVETIRSYLKNIENQSENRVDGSFPDILFNKKKQEVLNEIMNLESRNDNFESPEELMNVVESYILENMSYDMLKSINLV